MNDIDDKRLTFPERCWERVVAGISWLHAFLARVLTATFTWLWRVQGRKSLSARFSVGMALLAIGSAAMAVLLPLKLPLTHSLLLKLKNAWPSLYIRWNDWAEYNPEAVRYLDNAGLLTSGTVLAFVAVVSCLLALVAAIFAWRRSRFSFWVLKAAWALHAVVLFSVARWTIIVPRVLTAADYRTFDDFTC